MFKYCFAAALAVSGVAIETQAIGRETQVQFRYNTAELRNQKSLASLYHRIRHFTKGQCTSGSHYIIMLDQECRVDLERELLQKIGSPALIEYAATVSNRA